MLPVAVLIVAAFHDNIIRGEGGEDRGGACGWCKG
jgi:hypothetical protein